MTTIDWSAFDKYPENTLTCACGAIFRAHSKIVMTPPPHMVSRVPCPACGKSDNIRACRSDPEIMTIGALRGKP